MFENQRPVDIFEKFDAPAQPSGNVSPVPELPNPAPKRWLLAASVGFVMAVIVGGGTWAYSFFNAPARTSVPSVPAAQKAPELPIVETALPAPEIPVAPVSRCVEGNFVVSSPMTSDDLGDADGDGLLDYQEATLYGSNPCAADGDADGYLDFAEACNGYNPAGAGKLPEGVARPASCPSSAVRAVN